MKEDRYFIKLSPNGETERIFDIGSSYTLKTLQDAVGGPTLVVGTTLGEAVKMVINGEGKIDGLKLNRDATDVAVIRSWDYVAGDAIFAVKRGEELVGFSESDAKLVEQILGVDKTLREERG